MTTTTTAYRFQPADTGLEDELIHLETRVKAAPADLPLRTYLFQLLCVLGQWARAAQQLDVCATIDRKAKPLVDIYQAAIIAEQKRHAVFADGEAPAFLETPPDWMNAMVAALRDETEGNLAGADTLRVEALAAAEEQPGSLDGKPIEWISDADSRLGPICEFIMGDTYGWIPYARLRHLQIAAPRDLRDLVWATALATLKDGRELTLLIPARYAQSAPTGDDLRLAKRTQWQEARPGYWTGHGQRVLVTDTADHPLLDIRRIEFN